MALRTIPYGYRIERGRAVIETEEADRIREIFSLYLSGRTLQSIADELTERQVVYYNGEVRWNKNTVNRIIQNERYIGGGEYPAIITEEAYHAANGKKQDKGGSTKPISPVLSHLKSICVCGKCGARYKRINTWGAREKWMCADGCKRLEYTDDTVLQKAVLNAINSAVRNSEVLVKETQSVYSPDQSVTKQENELYRLLDQVKVDFAVTAECVLNLAAAKFLCCEYDRGELTEALQSELLEMGAQMALTVELMKIYVRRVKIYPDGRITVVFCNNAEVTGLMNKQTEKDGESNGSDVGT